MTSCTVEDCDRPSKARGLCTTHYQRLRKTGTTDDPRPRPILDPKTCPRCGVDKPLDGFPLNASRYDGHGGYCRSCQSTYRQPPEYTADYRTTHREELASAQRARHDRHYARILQLKLALACIDCGWQPRDRDEARWLHFDHRDPATKHAVGAGAFRLSWTWERIERELALCDPRCLYCHPKRTGQQRRDGVINTRPRKRRIA